MDAYLNQVNTRRSFRTMLQRALVILSVMVIIGVFWGLKLTGITMAGEAFCGIEEHAHDESCNWRLICPLEEAEPHTHTKECLEQVLISLGEAELKDIIEKDHGAELTCRFCNKKYQFSENELNKLLLEAKS